MKKYSRVISVMSLIAMLIISTGCKPWTIVKNEKVEEEDGLKIYFENDDFDANAFAEEIWLDKLGEYYEERKADATEILKGLKTDEENTGELYAIGENDTGSKWQFIVEGKAKILEVDTHLKAGIIMIDLEPYDGISDMTIQIGPVIKGTSIRDTLDFIKLDDFSNQVEFASISRAFNTIVVEEVIGEKDFNKYIDEEITFLGCFTYTNVDEILVTPIEISGLERD